MFIIYGREKMKIASITMAGKVSNTFKSAKKREVTPLIDLSTKKPEEPVAYCTWGNNYVYPVYAKDVAIKKPTTGEPLTAKVADSTSYRDTQEDFSLRHMYHD